MGCANPQRRLPQREATETMKNIQVIDGAENCVYDIFSATDEEFALIFEAGADVVGAGVNPRLFAGEDAVSCECR